MKPSAAEVARTLLRGRLPGVLHLGDHPPFRTPHATDAAGRPLVLARDGDPLSSVLTDSLSHRDGRGDPLVALSVDDVPPVAGAPSRGSARVFGRMHRLAPGDAARAAHGFAAANPCADLLDVGRGVSIHLIEVDRVRLDTRRVARGVPVTEYTTAEADPLHELEADLLTDLADHHAAQVESYFRFLLAMAGLPCCPRPPRAVRLDRYGFVVDTGAPESRWVRLDFHQPVHCRHELAHVLRPVLFGHGHCSRDR